MLLSDRGNKAYLAQRKPGAEDHDHADNKSTTKPNDKAAATANNKIAATKSSNKPDKKNEKKAEKKEKNVILKESSLERIFAKGKQKEFDEAVAEIQGLKNLNFPFMAVVYSGWEERGLLYIEREFIEGITLAAAIENRKGNPFPEGHIQEWLCHLLLTLRFLQKKNLIHRNIKINNVFVTAGIDGQSILKMCDMMSPKIFEESRALMANSPIGGGILVAGHFAPELFSPTVRERAVSDKHRKENVNTYDMKIDIWALGVLLYQMITLRYPFPGEEWIHVVEAIKVGGKEPIEPGFKYSNKLLELVERLLSVDITKRPSAAILVEDYAKPQMIISLITAAQLGRLKKMKQVIDLCDKDMKILCGNEPPKAETDGYSDEAENIQEEQELSQQNGGENIEESPKGFAADTAIHKAARYNKTEAVAMLLDNGVPIDTANGLQDTALHVAASSGSLEVAELLLQRKAKVDSRGQFSRTPLHYAIERAVDDDMTMINLFLGGDAKRATLEVRDTQMGATPLHLACWLGSMKITQRLLECGASVQSRDNEGDSPLHYACFQGHLEIAKFLIEEKQAQIDARNKLGRTPLHTAAENNRLDILKMLINHGAKVDALDQEVSLTPLHLAATFGHADVARALIAAGADKEAKDATGDRPIHRAAASNHPDVVYVLLDANCDANAEEGRYGRSPLFVAATEGHPEVVQTLLKLGGSDPEARELNSGNMPIHAAAAMGHVDVVKVLLEKNPELANKLNDARRNKARTPLHLAVAQGHVKVVDLLLSLPTTDTTIKDTIEKTPLLVMRYELNENPEISSEVKDLMAKTFRKYNVTN